MPHSPQSPGIPELVRLLQSRGQAVYLVSGGFRQVCVCVPMSACMCVWCARIQAETYIVCMYVHMKACMHVCPHVHSLSALRILIQELIHASQQHLYASC